MINDSKITDKVSNKIQQSRGSVAFNEQRVHWQAPAGKKERKAHTKKYISRAIMLQAKQVARRVNW